MFEDTKEIRTLKSKDRQYNGQKIPKRSEPLNQRTDNTMAKRYQRDQNP